MTKRTKLMVSGGVLLALIVAGYSYVQVSEARRLQELDRLVQTLSQAAKAGPAGAAACAKLMPAVGARMAELEARHSGDQLWRIYRGMGDCSINAGMPAEAIKHYEKIIVATPQEGRAHGDLAWAYSRAGRHAEAVRSAQLAVQLSPNAWQAHRVLGRVLSGAGQYDAAIQSLQRALTLAPPAEQAAAQKAIDALQTRLAAAQPASLAMPAAQPPLQPAKPLPLLDKQ